MHKLARETSVGALLVMGFLVAIALLSMGLLSWAPWRERINRSSDRNGAGEAAFEQRTSAVPYATNRSQRPASVTRTSGVG